MTSWQHDCQEDLRILVRVTELERGRALVEVERIDMSMGHELGNEPGREEILDNRNWII